MAMSGLLHPPHLSLVGGQPRQHHPVGTHRRPKASDLSAAIGNVSLKGRWVARVRYCLYQGRAVDRSRMAQGCSGVHDVRRVADGDIEILESETALYSDVLYTLHLEEGGRWDIDFYARPTDVVEGRYRIDVKSCHRESFHRRIRR